MAKVVENSDIVPLYCMRDGDVAEVISSEVPGLEEETVIQRYDTTIILIGKPWGQSFSGLLSSSKENKCKVRVKILSKGTLIRL